MPSTYTTIMLIYVNSCVKKLFNDASNTTTSCRRQKVQKGINGRVRMCYVTTLSTPKLSTPKLSTPKLSTPKLSTPKLSTPKLGTTKLSYSDKKSGPL